MNRRGNSELPLVFLAAAVLRGGTARRFAAVLGGGTARRLRNRTEPENILSRVSGKHAKEILDTFSVISLHQQMEMVSADRILITPSRGRAAKLPHHRDNQFFMSQEAPPANCLMRFQSDVQRQFRIDRPTRPPLVNCERSTVISLWLRELVLYLLCVLRHRRGVKQAWDCAGAPPGEVVASFQVRNSERSSDFLFTDLRSAQVLL